MINRYILGSPEAKAALASPEVKYVFLDLERSESVIYTGEHIPPGVKTKVPQIVSMRQARLALLDAGLLGSVEAAVSVAPQETKIAWEYAIELGRSDSLVTTLAAALGLADIQVDGLFILASLK